MSFDVSPPGSAAEGCYWSSPGLEQSPDSSGSRCRGPGAPRPEGTFDSVPGCVCGLLAHLGLFFCRDETVACDDPRCRSFALPSSMWAPALVRMRGRGSGGLPGCTAPPPTARSAGPGPPPWSRGLLTLPSSCHALSLPSFPPCQRGLSGKDVLASPGQRCCPLPLPCPVPGRWGHVYLLPSSVTGRSFPAVVVEGCVLVECLGNRARPHLHHARPMATAEPARRHDGGWYLCIFSFCCIALRAGNKGCGHPATRIQQPVLCTPPVGIAAAEEGGSTAC